MRSPDHASRKRTQTRNHIATVSFELFERQGYEAVTMEQIAVDAGLARATLYNHFPVKEAVLVHCLHERLARDLQSLMPEILSRPTFASRLATLLEPSMHWWELHRQYAAPYIRYRFQQVRDERVERASSDMIMVYVQLIADAQSAGELRVDQSAARLAQYLHFLYLCALMSWLGDPEVSLDDELTRAMEFFVEGAARCSHRNES
jgi:AcrR family transcriptional regulator